MSGQPGTMPPLAGPVTPIQVGGFVTLTDHDRGVEGWCGTLSRRVWLGVSAQD